MKDLVIPATDSSDVARIGDIDVVPRILEVVCRTTGMGFAAVARVTQERWIACAVRDEIGFGLGAGGELPVQTTLCDEVRGANQTVAIDNVAQDAVYRDHQTPKTYGLQSYISVPINVGGRFFGTLCAIDPNPAVVKTPEIIGMFELFADLIGMHLDAQDRIAMTEAALLNEREAAELREQFIAVLGHDLRNPLASVQAGARLLSKAALTSKEVTILALMQSSVTRMAGLVNDVLDFARGRLGGGFDIERSTGESLQQALEQVLEELRTAYPDRRIGSHIHLDRHVACDSRRIAQLFSNLVANALVHGAKDGVVRTNARTLGDAFELSVANPGLPIDASTLRSLFKPFSREKVRPNQQGLGLGLYIAAEIAKAHGGTLTVASDATETVFTFHMPLPAG